MSKVYLETIENYESEELFRFVQRFFEEHKSRIQSARNILLKPNLLQASPPDRAVTTHPVFVRTVVKALRSIYGGRLILADSPGANFLSYDRVLDVTGMYDACTDYDVEIQRIEHAKPVSESGHIYSSVADNADLIINLAKLKMHSLTGITLCVKNLFGLVPGNRKTGYHRENPDDNNLGASIYELYEIFNGKTLHLLDGILAHEGDGPSGGRAKYAGLVAAGECGVSVDIAVSRILGLADDFGTTTRAAILAGFDPSVVVMEKYGEIIPVKLIIPTSKRLLRLPSFIKKIVADKVYVKPYILNDNCIRCMLCVKSCPVDAIDYKSENMLVLEDKCIECYCCHEVCESEAIELRRSLLHRMFVK